MGKKPVVKRKVETIVKYLAERLKKNGVHVSQIIVFGSQIKGTANSESDIDLIVVSADFYGKDIFKRVKMIGDAHAATIEKFMIPLDILLESPNEVNPDFGVVVFAA